MGNNIVNDILQVSEMVCEDSCKEFFEMIESIPLESEGLKNLDSVLTRKRKQLGLSNEEFNSFSMYLLGKLHGGNNVKT